MVASNTIQQSHCLSPKWERKWKGYAQVMLASRLCKWHSGALDTQPFPCPRLQRLHHDKLRCSDLGGDEVLRVPRCGPNDIRGTLHTCRCILHWRAQTWLSNDDAKCSLKALSPPPHVQPWSKKTNARLPTGMTLIRARMWTSADFTQLLTISWTYQSESNIFKECSLSVTWNLALLLIWRLHFSTARLFQP